VFFGVYSLTGRTMFADSQRPSRRAWNLSLGGSVAFHCVVLLVLCLRPVPIFVQPALVAQGNHGEPTPLYFAPQGAQQTFVAAPAKPVPARLHLPSRVKPKFNARTTVDKSTEAQNTDAAATAVAGSPRGSEVVGYATGPDVRPAIETTLVDPPVYRSEIPSGVEGDVVVEVTIDEFGKVIDAKLLKGLGHGIDEKVLATVRNWRYRPATKDGIPIPSKYDAHFHYPS
jgi:periplasmic protein TonB